MRRKMQLVGRERRLRREIIARRETADEQERKERRRKSTYQKFGAEEEIRQEGGNHTGEEKCQEGEISARRASSTEGYGGGEMKKKTGTKEGE